MARYLSQIDTIDHPLTTEALATKTMHLAQKLVTLKDEMKKLAERYLGIEVDDAIEIAEKIEI